VLCPGRAPSAVLTSHLFHNIRPIVATYAVLLLKHTYNHYNI
jgi:hypothetical protein